MKERNKKRTNEEETEAQWWREWPTDGAKAWDCVFVFVMASDDFQYKVDTWESVLAIAAAVARWNHLLGAPDSQHQVLLTVNETQ